MVVLDTHAWIWWVTQNRKLLPTTLHEYLSREGVPHNISAISVYEVSVLAGRERVNVGMPIHEWIDEATDGSNIRVIPVDKQIAEYAGRLPDIHGDPMDRIIIAIAGSNPGDKGSLDSSIPWPENTLGIENEHQSLARNCKTP